jgi:CheY-like chemotaxis protein
MPGGAIVGWLSTLSVVPNSQSASHRASWETPHVSAGPVNSIGTVLLIDDELVDRILYERAINISGRVTTLVCFTNAADALGYLRKTKETVDVVFLDVNMPKMNGFSFLEAASDEFGKDFAKLVVIMLTMELTPQDFERVNAIDLPTEYINKPLSVEHVVTTANRLAIA